MQPSSSVAAPLPGSSPAAAAAAHLCPAADVHSARHTGRPAEMNKQRFRHLQMCSARAPPGTQTPVHGCHQFSQEVLTARRH